ncbi:Hypothetical predicted protein [Mytilus galloprovincialis]|uniref:Uncharacterized protein n=1 Tax=Mytilus galloprovincialis TaxID=29158 RepID=A0A8B6CXP2_MYTGA|nr:Hypothetical predicted protein [Mytilus galloprovincialis]
MSSNYKSQRDLISWYYNKEHMQVSILDSRYNIQKSSRDKKSETMYRQIVLSFIVLSASMFEASKVSENVLKDNKGQEYDVIDVQIGNTDIAIIMKDGVILADEITSKNKDTSDSNTCYEAFEDNASIPNNTKAEIKEECGDLDIAYVKAVDCNTGMISDSVAIETTNYMHKLGKCFKID